MISAEYVRLMAAYGDWQNHNIYTAADTLSDAGRRAERGAFFGSIHATLNHLLWGDKVWMHRLAGTAAPPQSDIPGSIQLHDGWQELAADRRAMDGAMLDWSKRLKDEDLHGMLSWYSGAMGAELTRPRWTLVLHMFNHGTHHRGQVHAMLTAAGAKPGDTDVPVMESEHFGWPVA